MAKGEAAVASGGVLQLEMGLALVSAAVGSLTVSTRARGTLQRRRAVTDSPLEWTFMRSGSLKLFGARATAVLFFRLIRVTATAFQQINLGVDHHTNLSAEFVNLT